MAKRRSNKRDDSLIIVLMDTQWQVSVVIAIVAFVIMRWLIPMLAKGFILLPIANVVSGFAPITALFFLFIGGISFVRNRGNAAPVSIEKDYSSYFPAQNSLPLIPSSTTPPPQAGFIPDAAKWISSHATQWGAKPRITDWSLELLQSLEWKRYEMLCAEYFRILGKRVETIAKGADGGVDARIYDKDSDILEYALQCKSWNSMVGVKEIRELFGVMAHESAGKGIFMTTSWFSNDAKQFAAEHKDRLFLLDGELFLSMLSNLPEEKRNVLLDFAIEGDYTTPTCASCGIKMIQRSGKAGEFWGCRNYPKCRSTFKIAKS